MRASTGLLGQSFIRQMFGGAIGVSLVKTCPVSVGLCSVGDTDVPQNIIDVADTYNTVTNLTEVKASLMRLLHAPNNSAFSAAMYYAGFSNNDFYMIKDCSFPTASCESVSGWTPDTVYLGYVRNTAVYGDDVRHIYAIKSLESGVGAEIATTGPYNTTVS